MHSDLSNGVTNVDSVTKYHEYIKRAEECGMTALGFSEHGSVFEWYHKKTAIEAAGMKYLHAAEFYLTETIEEKIRDNYHCVLVARNYAGFLELNRLASAAFNRKDNHFYYTPRISFDELFSTSDNILVTTACVGGVLGKGSDEVQQKFLRFLVDNKHRCFLEVGHHMDEKQVNYNRHLYEIHQQTGIPLIAGTDTHALNEAHELGRSILQKAKSVIFEGEDKWDLKFKTYDELVMAYRKQGSLPEEVYMQAIENTNVMADMVEVFTLDKGTKYPHIYENPEQVFYDKVQQAIETHPYASKNHAVEELKSIVDEEFEVYKATKSIDFMLLQSYLREWERENGIESGYGRGSVSGSMIAYLLGITQMDSARFNLNFFRFMNPSRVTNADIDSDYSGRDRDTVKRFLLQDKMNIPTIQSAEIITFNTIALKGAVRDVCRALYGMSKDESKQLGEFYDAVEPSGALGPGGGGVRLPANLESARNRHINIANEICSKLVREGTKDVAPPELRKQYPDVFKYVDIVSGTIVSIGTHPSGVLLSDLPIVETIGLCSTSASEYPVSMINMKELDELMYVKLDILGLDNIGVINDTCKALGIERLTPDNTDLDDMDVWRSIRDDTTLIFQWESNSAQAYLKKFMSEATIAKAQDRVPNFSMLKWMSFGNGLIRPACASFRDSVANGEFYDNGFDELNEFLAPEAGRIAMQETIMQFLVKFCGYSNAESDNVRRGIAKKKGTEKLIPEIKERFISYTSEHYGLSAEKCEEVIVPFIQVILDASDYAFSWNHSDSYSAIGYICGYLRYYHPLEFLTSALNIFGDNLDKTAEITKYARRVGVQVTMPKWGLSRSEYVFNTEKNVIAKGLTSIKYMSSQLADELYTMANKKKYTRFVDVLADLDSETSCDTRQLDILIKLDFFSEFGNQRELLRITDLFYQTFKRGQAKQIKKAIVDGTPLEPIISKYAVGVTKSGGVAKSYTLLDVRSILQEAEDALKAVGMPDLNDIDKVRNFYDVMGYIGYVSGKQEDRPKLYVLDVFPLVRRKDNKQFGYSVVTKSIGSGKESRFTVANTLFKALPIQKGDIILCRGFQKDGAYYRMTSYEKIF